MSPSQYLFSIQPGAPAVHAASREVDLAAAIQAIYPSDTDDAILNWNRVAVRVGYRYDVSVLVDDLLPLIAAIGAAPSGTRCVTWGSDTFNARWDVHWTGDELSVDAEWHSISGDYEDILNARPRVQLRRQVFLAEWSRLLAVVLAGVESSGVVLERPGELRELRRLTARGTVGS